MLVDKCCAHAYTCAGQNTLKNEKKLSTIAASHSPNHRHSHTKGDWLPRKAPTSLAILQAALCNNSGYGFSLSLKGQSGIC